jgi:hypothetical protein
LAHLFAAKAIVCGDMDVSSTQKEENAPTESAATDAAVASSIDSTNTFYPQSGIEQSYGMGETLKSQNVRFSSQYNGPRTAIDSTPDPLRSTTDTNDTELSNFFSRPIKISEFQWFVGAGIDQLIDPWSLYFSNKRVINRITTYNLMRANLHVKIVINGNGFYYGRALAMYGPFSDSFYDSLTNTSQQVDVVQWSQRPKIFIDPTNSMGGEMIIPFHSYQNNTWVQNTGVSQLGNLWIRSLNILQHANAGEDPITVSVFAWAEDVTLSVLTSMDAGGLEPQSGVEVDEANSRGVVSGPASAIAKIAGHFSGAPVIGPYATATSKVAATTAQVAKMFGYSRPPLTKAPEPLRPTPVSSLANTTVPDVVQKLSVDDKQELTIDQNAAGYGKDDPLSIKSIAMRESYLTTFDWEMQTSAEGETNSPTTGLLWNCRVDPTVFATTNAGTGFLFPACCAAAMPFTFWTGTMKFRFQIVCSSFHKGRIKVVFDPNFLASNEYNTNYQKVIDIAEEQDVTVDFGIGKTTNLLPHGKPGITPVGSMYNTTPLTYDDQLGNGVVSVFVVNELTSPNTTANNDIQINVFVSMGDDFEVFVPDAHFQQFLFAATPIIPIAEEEKVDTSKSTPLPKLKSDRRPDKRSSVVEPFKPQSGMEKTIPEAEHTDEPNAPVHDVSENVAVPGGVLPHVNLMFTGESIQSFRCMLKRYNKWLSLGVDGNTEGRNGIRFDCPAYPLLRGTTGNSIHETSNGIGYNYVNTLLLHWVSNMFSGWRGSLRYKILPRRGRTHSDMCVTRHLEDYGTQIVQQPYLDTLFSTQSEIAKFSVYDVSNGFSDSIISGVTGTAFTISEVNPILEYEIPYYSRYRFVPGKILAPALKAPEWVQNQTIWINEYNIATFGGGDNIVACYDIYCAVGEDFQAYMFSGLPRMYYEPDPPDPDANP